MSQVSEYPLKLDSKVILRLLNAHPIRSRKALQKLVYLLQKGERVPLGLDYRMYHYGPYSRELDHRIKMLELLGLVEVERDINEIPTYRLAESVASSLEPDPALDEKIVRVVDNFGQRMPNDLELVTSVHYLASQQEKIADEERLFQEMVAWKGRKFTRRELESGLEELRSVGYLPAK